MVEREAVVEIRDAANSLLREGERLLLLGGSCVIAVGLCAAISASGRTPRMVYVDRHFDLNTPNSTLEGSLSWMGLAHCLDLPSARSELSQLDQTGPLLTPATLVYLGVDESAGTDWEVDQRHRLRIPVVTQDSLVTDPQQSARSALGALGEGEFVVHIDVDVLDFLDAPLAENVNGRNTGPTIEQLGTALTTLWRHPDCLGMSIGQLVPAHANSAPESLSRFVTMLSQLPAT
jgi:arginase